MLTFPNTLGMGTLTRCRATKLLFYFYSQSIAFDLHTFSEVSDAFATVNSFH